MRNQPLVLALVGITLLLGSIRSLHGQVNYSPYHLARRIAADSSGGAFLGVDSKWRRLYGAGTAVVDIDHDSIVGHLPALVGHAFAFAPDLDRGITRRAAIFDLRTLAVIDSGVGHSARTVAYDDNTHRAFVIGDSTIVIDVVNDRRIARLQFGSDGTGSVTDGAGHIFISLETDSLIRLNTRTLSVDARWVTKGCGSATGLAMDHSSRRLFVSCRSALLVLNADNGHVVSIIHTDGPALQIAFDSTMRLIFCPEGSGKMVVIQEQTPDQFGPVGLVETAEARPVAVVDEMTHKLFSYGHDSLGALRVLVFRP